MVHATGLRGRLQPRAATRQREEFEEPAAEESVEDPDVLGEAVAKPALPLLGLDLQGLVKVHQGVGIMGAAEFL